VIPTMILVGLVIGLVPPHWDRRGTAIALTGVLGAVAWGLVVGEPIAGTVLAIPNVAVGVVVGLALGAVVRGLRRASRPRRAATLR
jgi:hypothetical protein